jgi:hypothetical protein
MSGAAFKANIEKSMAQKPVKARSRGWSTTQTAGAAMDQRGLPGMMIVAQLVNLMLRTDKPEDLRAV